MPIRPLERLGAQPTSPTSPLSRLLSPPDVEDAPASLLPAWTERVAVGGPNAESACVPRERGPLGRMGVPADSTAPYDQSPFDSSSRRPVIGSRGVPDACPPLPRALPEIRFDSDDPGDYYCEHVAFVGQEAARASGSTVLSNSEGDPLVGFVHVPQDRQARRDPIVPPNEALIAARHHSTRQVAGAAIAGYFHEAVQQQSAAPLRPEGALAEQSPPAPEPVRIMITGFGPFGRYSDNPTGAFVSHRSNIDAAMEEAFGPNLVGRPAADADMNRPLSYQVRQEDGSIREVQIRALRLPVSDEALATLPREMAAFRPHAVISMGMRPGRQDHYDVETRADAGRLVRDADGAYRHDGGGDRTRSGGHRNRSLERAIEWARTHPVIP